MSKLDQISEDIDRLLHDAQHAESGALFAMQVGHKAPAVEMVAKRDRLLAEARKLYAENPGARWPHPDDCEWPAEGEAQKSK